MSTSQDEERPVPSPGQRPANQDTPSIPRRLSLDSSSGRARIGFHPPSELPQLPPAKTENISLIASLPSLERVPEGGKPGHGDGLPLSPHSGLGPELGGTSQTTLFGSDAGLIDLGHWSHLSEQFVQGPSTLKDTLGLTATYQLVLVAMAYNVKIVDCKEVKCSGLIGSGANMTVFRGSHNGRTVALKRIRQFQVGTNQARDAARVLQSLEMEIRTMSAVFLNGHENIAKLDAFTWETDADGELVPVLIMELAIPESPTLASYMATVDPRDFRSKGWLISDIVSGLAAIHQEKIIHGDLKPENILLFIRRTITGAIDQGIPVVAKISDFGFCEDVHENRGATPDIPAGGTEYWNAPECMSSAPGNFRPFARRTERDMYSCGLVIWYILSNTLPLGPTVGSEWERNRTSLRAAKINGDVQQRYKTWFRDSLSMTFATEDDIHSFDDDLNEDLDPTDFSYHMMVEKMKKDPLFKTQVVFDELLFRNEGRAGWVLKTADGEVTPCVGYLPVMVPIVAMNMLSEPTLRLGALRAMPKCLISRHREPSKIYACFDRYFVDGKPPGTRHGWQEWATRFRSTFAPARAIQSLSPEMRASLLRALHMDADGLVKTPTAPWLLHTIYYMGYGVPVDLALSQKYAIQGLELMGDSAFGDEYKSIYMSLYYANGWFRKLPLEPQKELNWSLKMFSGMYQSDIPSRVQLSRASFEHRLGEALRAMQDQGGVSRFLRITASAYMTHQSTKESNRNDNILRGPDIGDALSEPRGNWVSALLSDNPRSFEALQEFGGLPTELRLDNEAIDSVLFMMTGMFGAPPSAEQIRTNMEKGLAQRGKAANNLLSICAEHGLMRLMKHLTSKHKLDINRKLASGRNALQEVLEQGRIHRAISLLACGASLEAVAEGPFIHHICADGHYRAIDFWTQLKTLRDDLRGLELSSWMFMDHYMNVYNLFENSERLNLNLQVYLTYQKPAHRASPIYFSITDNCWPAFVALLRYGVDPALPCMGSLDALQTSVVIRRPMHVATLCGPEFSFPSGSAVDGTPSLLHLASLGKEYFADDKMWTYGDFEEVKDDAAGARMDESNHQRLILELLVKNMPGSIEARDQYGMTPFLFAVLQGNLVAARWFESNGCELDQRASDGCNALHLAVVSGSEEMVEYVMSITSLVAEKDATGQTPLHFAACQPEAKILSRLLDTKPDLGSTDGLGRTAFMTSIDHGQEANLAKLLKWAHASLGDGKLTDLLGIADNLGRSTFHVLATMAPGSLQNITSALDFDLPSLYDGSPKLAGEGWSVPHLIALNHPHLLRRLVLPSTVNVQGYKGITCLHVSYYLQDQWLQKELISLGANPKIKDQTGKTPRDYDKREGERSSREELMRAITASLLGGLEEQMPPARGDSCLVRSATGPLNQKPYLPEFGISNSASDSVPFRDDEAERLVLERAFS